jgi:hypothetical protein
MFDPAVSNCPDDYDLNSPYVIEKHVYQPIELEAMTEFNQKEVKRLVEESKNQPIEVYEYYSTFKDDEIGLGNTGKYIKARVYLGKLEVKEKDGTMKPDGVILKKEKVSSFPYKKLDYFTIEGRALGLGIAEMLFDVQERWNEMANDKAVSMRLGNKQLFQTRDTSTAGNILTDLLNGDILQVNSEITKIDTSERNLQAYGQEENNMLYHVRSLANAQEVLTGEALPSRTPFRSLALQQQSAGKLFEFIRQNIGMFLEEVFIEWVLPMFDKNVIKEHTFRMYEPEDILQIVEADINSRINESIKKYVIQTGYFPTQEEIDIIKADLKSREGKQKELFLDIIEGWLDFDYDIQIDITGEKINKQAEVETGINILQLLAQNPQAMSDERFMKLIQYIATSSGLDPMVIPSGSPAEVPTAGEMGAGSMNPTASIPNASMPQQPSN